MELFQPNAKLVRKKISETPEEWKYLLYSVTLCDHCHYEADDFTQSSFSLNSDGHYAIELNISKNTSLPVDKEYVKPVVHMADLGSVSITDTNPTIEVKVYEGAQLKGKGGVLHKATAEEDAMPIGMGMLNGTAAV